MEGLKITYYHGVFIFAVRFVNYYVIVNNKAIPFIFLGMLKNGCILLLTQKLISTQQQEKAIHKESYIIIIRCSLSSVLHPHCFRQLCCWYNSPLQMFSRHFAEYLFAKWTRVGYLSIERSEKVRWTHSIMYFGPLKNAFGAKRMIATVEHPLLFNRI